MKPAPAFWEYPDFWPLVWVLLLFAAMATLAICAGPAEIPYDEDNADSEDEP